MKRKAILTRLGESDLRKLVALAAEEHYGNQSRVMRVALRRLYDLTFPEWEREDDDAQDLKDEETT